MLLDTSGLLAYHSVRESRHNLHHQALDLLDERSDKAYSLCDAVSFVLMQRENISEALTTDHHFEQEGFRRLL